MFILLQLNASWCWFFCVSSPSHFECDWLRWTPASRQYWAPSLVWIPAQATTLELTCNLLRCFKGSHQWASALVINTEKTVFIHHFYPLGTKTELKPHRVNAIIHEWSAVCWCVVMCSIGAYREVKGQSWFEIFCCSFEMESVGWRHNLYTSQLCLHHFTACKCTQTQTNTNAHTPATQWFHLL